MPVAYDPLAPDVRADPYPFYRALRDEAPVHRVERLGIYAISRYADVIDVVKQPELYSSRAIQAFLLGGIALAPEQMTADERELFSSPILIATDPPDHTRMRQLVNRGFGGIVIALWLRPIDDEAAHRADVDDRAAARREHMFSEGARAPECPV